MVYNLLTAYRLFMSWSLDFVNMMANVDFAQFTYKSKKTGSI